MAVAIRYYLPCQTSIPAANWVCKLGHGSSGRVGTRGQSRQCCPWVAPPIGSVQPWVVKKVTSVVQIGSNSKSRTHPGSAEKQSAHSP